MNTRPTIKDVASVAGVHFTTVSLALRGHPSIPAATRDRIVAAAARIGYQKDKVFSALSSRRSRQAANIYTPKIAAISNRSPENGYEHLPHLRRIEAATRTQAESLGYQFEMLFLDEGHHDSESLLKYLREQEIRGVILAAIEPDRRELDLPWDEFSLVKVESRHARPALPSSAHDQGHAVLTSMRELHRLGYRRIGLAMGRQDELMTDDVNRSAYLHACHEFGIEILEPLLFPVGANGDDAAPLFGPWIRHEKPDAVLCNWTNIQQMIEESGYAVPRKVSCACSCMGPRSRNLAGVIANWELVAERATVILATQLRAERRGIPPLAPTTLVQGTWKDGITAPKIS